MLNIQDFNDVCSVFCPKLYYLERTYKPSNMNRLAFLFIILPVSLFAQIIYIPDPYFKALLIETDCVYVPEGEGLYRGIGDVDLNDDGEIDSIEAGFVEALFFREGDPNVSSIQGLDKFINLKHLSIKNFGITDFNADDYALIKTLSFRNTPLSNFNAERSNGLEWLVIDNCSIESVLLKDKEKLKVFSIEDNDSVIDKIGLHNIPQLKYANLQGNRKVNEIEFINLRNLRYIRIGNNNLESLRTSNVPLVKELIAPNNQLTEINCSSFRIFEKLDCSNNPNLIELNINNDRDEEVLISGNTSLERICVDNDSREIHRIESLLNSENLEAEVYTDCLVNNEEEEPENVMIVYPNPTKDFLHFTEKSITRIEVHNQLGVLVRRIERPVSPINVSEFVPGIYLLKVFNREGAISTVFRKQ